jgi:hypothetical protein
VAHAIRRVSSARLGAPQHGRLRAVLGVCDGAAADVPIALALTPARSRLLRARRTIGTAAAERGTA